MKKLILFSIIFISLSFTFCGGKEMDDPADGSNSGPTYRNEFDDPRTKDVEADSTKNK